MRPPRSAAPCLRHQCTTSTTCRSASCQHMCMCVHVCTCVHVCVCSCCCCKKGALVQRQGSACLSVWPKHARGAVRRKDCDQSDMGAGATTRRPPATLGTIGSKGEGGGQLMHPKGIAAFGSTLVASSKHKLSFFEWTPVCRRRRRPVAGPRGAGGEVPQPGLAGCRISARGGAEARDRRAGVARGTAGSEVYVRGRRLSSG